MKTVMTGICNGLMAESIRHILESDGEFRVLPINGPEVSPVDIVLLEVAYNPGYTVDERMAAVKSIRSQNPDARILLLCDENSTPELARKVALAKKDGLIDDFLYSSVSESYLTAMLYAM
jgi:hypothetical protein